MLKDFTANLMVNDVNKTIEFYKQLGFELIASVPEEGQFNWAMIGRDGINMMLQTRQSLVEELPLLAERPIKAGLTFYIRVENMEAFRASLPESVTILKDVFTTFYSTKEIIIEDCNGYILAFAENNHR